MQWYETLQTGRYYLWMDASSKQILRQFFCGWMVKAMHPKAGVQSGNISEEQEEEFKVEKHRRRRVSMSRP